jgi:hypothetical protein
MPVVWRFSALAVFCLLAAGAGWAAGRRTSRPMGLRLQILVWIVFSLWCVAWLPTLVGALSESPGRPDTPERLAIRIVCAANALLYYVGGGTWLVTQSWGRGIGFIAAVWIPCCFLNAFGPITLLIAKLALDRSQKEHETVEQQPTT